MGIKVALFWETAENQLSTSFYGQMGKSGLHNFVDFLDWDDFKLWNSKKQSDEKSLKIYKIKLENSNSDADFEPFKIIKCFDFEHMKKKLSNYFL